MLTYVANIATDTGMEPAQTIIEKLGGASAVASIVGIHRTRVYGWMYPKERGGTGGTIPIKHAQRLLQYAEGEGIAVTASDFFGPPHSKAEQ